MSRVAETITQAQARRFLLAHQELRPPHSFQWKSGILDYIRRVNCIQFDPLNIAGQNPDLVLQAASCSGHQELVVGAGY